MFCHVCLIGEEQYGSASEIAEFRKQHQNIYQPPSRKFRVPCTDINNNEKIYELLYEILRYLMFMYLVLLIAYGERDSNTYRVNSNILQ